MYLSIVLYVLSMPWCGMVCMYVRMYVHGHSIYIYCDGTAHELQQYIVSRSLRIR